MGQGRVGGVGCGAPRGTAENIVVVHSGPSAPWVCPVWWVWVGAKCQASWPTSLPPPPLQPPAPKELPCSSDNSQENLLHQAMQNSGIVLERVTGEEGSLEPVPPTMSSPQPLGDGPPELPLLEVEQVETVGTCAATELVPGGHTLDDAVLSYWPGC